MSLNTVVYAKQLSQKAALSHFVDGSKTQKNAVTLSH